MAQIDFFPVLTVVPELFSSYDMSNDQPLSELFFS